MIRRNALNIVLVAVTAILAGVNIGMKANPAQRNVEFLPDMMKSVPYDSFDANPNFADGKTLREPVPGTVLHHEARLRYTAAPADAVRAGVELRSPFAPGNLRAAQRGAQVYANFCLPCHGSQGRGDGMVSQRGYPAPPSLLAANARKLADGRIFHIVTYGQNNMPPYANLVGPDDRWAAVLYVRELQRTIR